MQGAQGTFKDTVVKDRFPVIYFFFPRRQHLCLGNTYSFELMKITLHAPLQRTFTNTRIGMPWMGALKVFCSARLSRLVGLKR